MIMKSSVYDLLADFARIYLPALATFYLSLAEIWGLPYKEQISASIMAVCALMGAFLKLSSAKYFDAAAKEVCEALKEEEADK